MKITLITGGSSGLGKEFAKIFLRNGNNCLLVGSNKERIEKARDEVKDVNKDVFVDTFVCDLSDINEYQKLLNYTIEKGYFVNNLVNNAGIGDRCDFKDMDKDKQIKINNLNINAVVYFTRAYLDEMLKNDEGHIINIGSIAAYVPGPYMSTYHASKSYIVNFGMSVAYELRKTNVHMFTLNPGPFESNFVNVAGNHYTFNKIKPMKVEKVAEYGYKMAMKGKVNKVIGFKNKLTCFAPRFFPSRFVAYCSANQMKPKKELRG
ncbi:SDR family oxidoreductase [bacterium]|nr:SDR family oxidoreductase [bacterium]